jgi:pyruvyltransferase
MIRKVITLFALVFSTFTIHCEEPSGIPLFCWRELPFENFGDFISWKLVERIVDSPIQAIRKKRIFEKKLLAIGSILYFATDGDLVWGSGINGKTLFKEQYIFSHLDVRAVRGPKTRKFLMENFSINCPEVYGDPALLFPYFFPEFKKKKDPKYEYIIIPHYSEIIQFPKNDSETVVYPIDPWNEVIEKILDSKFVISSSLHGVILAEAYGIPARYLRVSENESLFKYEDYYEGTGRPYFRYAKTVEEALLMGGEPPFRCDLEKLYTAFPFEYWPNVQFKPLIINLHK